VTGLVFRKRTNGVIYFGLAASLAFGGFVLHLDRGLSGPVPIGLVLLNIVSVALVLSCGLALAMHPSVTMWRTEGGAVVTLSYFGLRVARIAVDAVDAGAFELRETRTESGHSFHEIRYRGWVPVVIASFARHDQFQSVAHAMGFGFERMP